MVTSRISIVIDRPLSVVWDYLMNADNYIVWQGGLLKVEATDGMREGSTITFTSVGMGKQFNLKAVVTKNDGRSSFTAISRRGPVTFDSAYYLTAAGASTNVEIFNQIETHVAFRLAESVLQSMSDAKTEADLRNLQAILEAQDHAAEA